MKFHLRYTPSLSEHIEGKVLEPGRGELIEHASFMPLAPMDVVTLDDNIIVGVEHLEPLWTVEVFLTLPADWDVGTDQFMQADHPVMVRAGELEQEWKRAAWVTRQTNFSFFVSSHSESWLKETFDNNAWVSWYQPIRTPDLKLDFTVAVQTAGADPTSEGPWA